MKKIAIIGTGGLGREVLGIIESINRVDEKWDFIGFYDDSLSNELINGYRILGDINSLNFIKENLALVIGIGDPNIKEKIRNQIKNSRISFPNIIHPSVIIYSNETVKVKEGVVIGANSVLTVNIEIENFVYINTASVISHDTKIGEYTMIMPTVSISTGVTIGKKVYISNGVKIDSPCKIENNSVVDFNSDMFK